MKSAFLQILSDPSFDTASQEAKRARNCAEKLSCWAEDEKHKDQVLYRIVQKIGRNIN